MARSFYSTHKRGTRGVKRLQFHIMLTADERAKLVKLSHKLEMSAADVVRKLLAGARI